MAKTIFDPDRRAEVLRRIGTLAATKRPLWGRMSAPEMVCHLHSALKQALGELETGPPAGPLSKWPINWLMIHLVPWPKGKAQSPPEFLTQKPSSWDSDLTGLVDLVARFADRGPAAAWPASRAFGQISGESWGVLTYRHVDHHLRQFGV